MSLLYQSPTYAERRKETNACYMQHTHRKNSLQLRFLVYVLVDELFPKCSYCNSYSFQTSPSRSFPRIHLTMLNYATCIHFTVWTTKNTKQLKNPHTFSQSSTILEPQCGKSMSNILKSRIN